MSHYKPYPAYKDSGVEWLGRVPEHWDVAPLKWHIERNDGGVWGDDPDGDGDTVVLRSTEQTVDGGWKLDDPAVRKLTQAERRSALLITGDLLVTKSSGSTLHIGKTTLVNSEVEALNCCYSNFMQRIRTKATFAPRLAWFLMNNDLARRQFELLSNTTTGLANLNGTMIGQILVAVPPPDEQATILRSLDRETARIDALVAKKTCFIELLREKRQALITHAVTKGLDPNVTMKDSGVEWLGEVPEHWLVVRFRDLCTSISTGPFGTALGNEDYVTGGVPVINPSHIVDEQCCPDLDISVSAETAERLSFWAMRSGDLVTARRGELGRAAVITDEQDGWICGTGSLRARPDSRRVLVEYLHTVLQSHYAREWLNLASVGATMANLNEGILGHLPLVLPPSIAEQEALLASLERQIARLSKIRERASSSVALLKERRAALITAAVTGQIDLRKSA